MVLAVNSSSINHRTWVIDTGATTHVACSVDLLTTIISVSGKFVSLPNGQKIHVSHTGIIRITEHIILTDVMVIPSFSFNMLSVSKLTETISCTLKFTSSHCLIQDTSSLRMIGIADQIRGLYCFTQPMSPVVHSCNDVSQFDLWHFRLGHSSIVSHAGIPGFKVSNFHCPICPIAKQSKLSFHVSNSKTKAPFDLIHIDIWGPCSEISINGHFYFLTILDDHTRVTWIYLMRVKSQARQLMI
ncbi:Retrovirus-related Pol polyprotein from transposon RE2 [Linum perenne]